MISETGALHCVTAARAIIAETGDRDEVAEVTEAFNTKGMGYLRQIASLLKSADCFVQSYDLQRAPKRVESGR